MRVLVLTSTLWMSLPESYSPFSPSRALLHRRREKEISPCAFDGSYVDKSIRSREIRLLSDPGICCKDAMYLLIWARVGCL